MEKEILYRPLTANELTADLFRHFSRRQEITRVWRKIDGQWVVVPHVYTEDWGEKEIDLLVWCLQRTLSTGGIVWGAFLDGGLKGFTSVESPAFGSRGQYRELSSLHVSDGLRGRGMGRKLFRRALAAVRELGGEKLYGSTNPCVESQAFYKAMGCVEAEEYSSEHVQRGPNDCQIECPVWE